MDLNFIALLMILLIGIVVLFAQMKLFEISKTLVEILAVLRNESATSDDESLSILRR